MRTLWILMRRQKKRMRIVLRRNKCVLFTAARLRHTYCWRRVRVYFRRRSKTRESLNARVLSLNLPSTTSPRHPRSTHHLLRPSITHCISCRTHTCCFASDAHRCRQVLRIRRNRWLHRPRAALTTIRAGRRAKIAMRHELHAAKQVEP